MREPNYDGMDQDIHQRIFGVDAGCPQYSREAAFAHRIVDAINASGRYRMSLKRVVASDADGDPDWQCEILTADGLDVLATEISEFECLAICRAVSGADIRLTVC